MKFDNMVAFFKHLSQTPDDLFPKVYFIIAKDEDVRDWCVKRALARFRSIYEMVHVPTLDQRLFESSLFSSKQLFFYKGEDVDVSLAEKFIDTPSRHSMLVLALPKLAANTRLFKKGEKEGVIFVQKELKPWEKEKWLTQYLQQVVGERKLSVTGNVIHALVVRSGYNPLILESEWEKLLTYTHGKPKITLEDLEAIGLHDEEASLFKLGDALVMGQWSQVFEILASLYQHNFSPIAWLRQLRSQWMILLELCYLAEEKLPLTSLQEKYPYLQGKILDQKIALSKKFSTDSLKKGIERLEYLEVWYKSYSHQDEVFSDYIAVQNFFSS